MIETRFGMMDEALFDKRTGTIDNEDEKTDWIEYWLGGHTFCLHKLELPSRNCVRCPAEQVHRSVNMILKKPAVFADGIAGSFS